MDFASGFFAFAVRLLLFILLPARVYGERPKPFVETEIWGAVEMAWNTEDGKHCQIQWASEPDSGFWYDIGLPLTGTGARVYLFQSSRGSTKKFYRVKKLD